MSFQQPQVGYVVNSGALINPGGAQGPGGAAGDSAMVGSMQLYPTTNAPAGWMICDGSNISRTAYPALFSLIGTAFGSGDGSTTFGLPDFRSRFPLGAGQGIGLTNRAIAATGGEELHTLLIAELASHTHAGVDHTHGMDHYHNITAGQFSHAHNVAVSGQAIAAAGASGAFWSGGAIATAAATLPAGSTAYASQTSAGWANTGAADRSLTTGSTGGDTGHNNMPPFLVVCVIIKVSATVPIGATTPLADTTQPGLLRTVSGATTDYVGGDNTCHALPQPGVSAGFVSKSAAYTLVIADSGKYVLCTGTGWTLTLPIAAVNLSFNVRNDQGLVANGTITLQPQSGSLIDGAASIVLLPGQMCTILSDGTNWRTFGLQRKVVLGTVNYTSPVAFGLVTLPAGYKEFELDFWNLLPNLASGNTDFAFSLSQDGGSTWPVQMYEGLTLQTAASGNAVQTQGSASAYAWLCGVTPASAVSLLYPAIAHLRLVQGTATYMTTFQTHGGGWNQTGGFNSHYLGLGFFNVAGTVNALKFSQNPSGLYSGSVTVVGMT